MHFQTAALLLERGLSPQDYETLGEEYDLLALSDGLVHDPETAAEDPSHLDPILKGPIVWLPGAVPYGNLWRDIRVGVGAARVRLCAQCFPPQQP